MKLNKIIIQFCNFVLTWLFDISDVDENEKAVCRAFV